MVFSQKNTSHKKYKLARECVWSATCTMKKIEGVYYCLECEVALNINHCVFQGLPRNEILLV